MTITRVAGYRPITGTGPGLDIPLPSVQYYPARVQTDTTIELIGKA